MEKIYVQIPAYRDVELVPTLLDLLDKAAEPSRIRISVCWQHADGDTLPQEILMHPNIEIIAVPYYKSQGCNWARRQLQKRWKQEEYTLLLDSHHRFIKDWDKHLIEMYTALKKGGSKKPFITAYLPPYNPQNDPLEREEDPLHICSLNREQGMLIYLVAYKIPWWQRQQPVEAKFASLHFIFTAGSFNEEILFDEDIYFFGDEVVTAIKAFTHGYDLYHPHFVVGWHLYKRENTRITHWDDHADYTERHARSHERLRNIFLGVEEEGFGKIKSLGDYETMICDKLITC